MNWKAFLTVLVLILTVALPTLHSADCTEENYMVHPELWKKAFDKVTEDYLNDGGARALKKMVDAGYVPGSPRFDSLMKNLPNVLKGLEAIEAIAADDFAKLETMGIEVGAKAALSAIGIPLVDQIWVTYEITKLSYEELEHQDCLLNIDLGYYRFLDDPKLHSGTDRERIEYYLMNYIHGEGLDPSGNSRDVNRRRLQCFVNEELPPGKGSR